MHDVLTRLSKTQPKNLAKTSSILKKPKNFTKTQNLGKKEWNAWYKREIRSYQMKKTWFWQKIKWRSDKVEFEEFGWERSENLSREIVENEIIFALTLYIENHKAWWIERCRNVSSFKTRELTIKELSRICREVSTAKGARWIKKLSSIYQASRKFLDGSSSYWAAIENAIKRSWRGSIDNLAVERCLAAVKIAQKQFFKKRKHIYECNQACYSTKDPNSILSSQKHLSTRRKKKSQAHRSKTHTH